MADGVEHSPGYPAAPISPGTPWRLGYRTVTTNRVGADFRAMKPERPITDVRFEFVPPFGGSD